MSPDWRVELSPRAERELEAMPTDVQGRILAALDRLTVDIRSCDVRKLAGGTGEFRLRVGDYRVIFTRDSVSRTYTVVKIADRKDAYR